MKSIQPSFHRYRYDGVRTFTARVSKDLLHDGVVVPCDHANTGTVYVIASESATGSINIGVMLKGVYEDIQNGSVDLSSVNPANYQKPNWRGIADSIRITGSASEDITIIVERE